MAGIFCREGDFWTLSFEDKVVRLKDAKGVRYIAHLLSRQGEELHVLDLAGLDRRPFMGSAREDVLDASARASYKRRLRELEDEITEADEIDDLAAAERARTERDAIVAELAAAYGLGGRPRKAAGDPIERARKAVTERVRTTVSHIEKVHPPLGRHLRRFVRTGTFCSYAPETRIEWDMEATSTTVSHVDGAIRVIVVDDHPLWRDTLRQVLAHGGFVVVGDASDGAEAVDITRRTEPDVVLMDLHLPGGVGGVEATRAIADVCPDTKVLVLSSSDVRTEVIDAVAAGAHGYVLKTADAAEITNAVRRVAAGELVFPPPLSRMVLAELRGRS